MKRQILNLLSFILLLLIAVVIVLWLRSYGNVEEFGYAAPRRNFYITISRGEVELISANLYDHNPYGFDPGWRYRRSDPLTDTDIIPRRRVDPYVPTRLDLCGLLIQAGDFIIVGPPPQSFVIRLLVPFWLLVSCLALLPGFRVLALMRRSRHKEGNLCPKCSYDLRAHAPGSECPECGLLVGSK